MPWAKYAPVYCCSACAITSLIWLGLQLWLWLSSSDYVCQINLFLNSETMFPFFSFQDRFLYSIEDTVKKDIFKLNKYFSPCTAVTDKWVTEAVEGC